MENNKGDLDASIQKKLEADTEFQASIAELPDEEKEQAINAKKPEIIRAIAEEERQARLKAEEIANNQKIRAEKAEEEAKKAKPVEPPKSEITLADLAVITNSKLHEDDIERVQKFAKDEGISLKEALKNEELQAILRIREEKRQVAQASNTGGSRRVAAQDSGKDILDKFERTGNLPESDEDIAKLARAQFDRKIKK